MTDVEKREGEISRFQYTHTHKLKVTSQVKFTRNRAINKIDSKVCIFHNV